MKKLFIVFLSLFFLINLQAQKIDKVRKVDKDKVELTEDELSKKKHYIIKLINLGYNDKSIRLKTRASKAQIKAIRREIGQ
ncbi:MAG: hypothetical protein CL836_00965 [Crocinitomicaceae bacterium]|jgi:hypothetical protein|nr:hypothetical protein [Crocinitomicaceae bacterium]MEC8968884.1 hypothetical protein [Bacteroidota bacterium]|tara:strand:- start:139 stop:381 length:243 start_codon:yes stop_codon:yes gene_type:complete